ncbi:MAG: hypothetical protein Q3X01_05950 [Agathobaculum sp.]|nr:hypothetical protein [Agathobaculum sp.]
MPSAISDSVNTASVILPISRRSSLYRRTFFKVIVTTPGAENKKVL